MPVPLFSRGFLGIVSPHETLVSIRGNKAVPCSYIPARPTSWLSHRKFSPCRVIQKLMKTGGTWWTVHWLSGSLSMALSERLRVLCRVRKRSSSQDGALGQAYSSFVPANLAEGWGFHDGLSGCFC